MENMASVAEFAKIVTDLPGEKQNEFFGKLKDVLSEEDYKATVQFISLYGMFINPAKYKAVRSALCEEMFGMEVPFSVKTMFEV